MTATHGVLVTFRRPELLADHLCRLAAQTRPLDTLVVVDNDADPAIRTIVEGPHGQLAAGSVCYLAMGGNPGPAGGFTAGITEALVDAADEDLIVLLDDNDPPRNQSVFADTLAAVREIGDNDPRLGGVGSWGAVLGRCGRLRMALGTNPSPVHYLAGGGCPHYRVSALRTVGGPDPALFFGFEELDLGLALHRAGFTLWSSGRASAHGWAEMMQPTRATPGVAAPSWRRYYSVRNLVVVLRKDGRHADAVFVSVVVGLAKPVLNLLIRPRLAMATLRLTSRAVFDGWGGRLGKRVEPTVPAA